MRTLIALLFIVGGITVAAFPFLQKQYYASEEQKLIDEFRELDEIFSQEERDHFSTDNPDVILSNQENEEGESPYSSDVIGIIQIDKIDVSLPVLQGATVENLNIGAGTITGTAPIGEKGNTGIAAHRSFTYGRQFNRLDEIELGDIVNVETIDGSWDYEVFDISIVVPEDVSVLEPMEDESIITLITCEPMYDPTHRLIVHAKKLP